MEDPGGAKPGNCGGAWLNALGTNPVGADIPKGAKEFWRLGSCEFELTIADLLASSVPIPVFVENDFPSFTKTGIGTRRGGTMLALVFPLRPFSCIAFFNLYLKDVSIIKNLKKFNTIFLMIMICRPPSINLFLSDRLSIIFSRILLNFFELFKTEFQFPNPNLSLALN